MNQQGVRYIKGPGRTKFFGRSVYENAKGQLKDSWVSLTVAFLIAGGSAPWWWEDANLLNDTSPILWVITFGSVAVSVLTARAYSRMKALSIDINKGMHEFCHEIRNSLCSCSGNSTRHRKSGTEPDPVQEFESFSKDCGVIVKSLANYWQEILEDPGISCALRVGSGVPLPSPEEEICDLQTEYHTIAWGGDYVEERVKTTEPLKGETGIPKKLRDHQLEGALHYYDLDLAEKNKTYIPTYNMRAYSNDIKELIAIPICYRDTDRRMLIAILFIATTNRGLRSEFFVDQFGAVSDTLATYLVSRYKFLTDLSFPKGSEGHQEDEMTLVLRKYFKSLERRKNPPSGSK